MSVNRTVSGSVSGCSSTKRIAYLVPANSTHVPPPELMANGVSRDSARWILLLLLAIRSLLTRVNSDSFLFSKASFNDVSIKTSRDDGGLFEIGLLGSDRLVICFGLAASLLPSRPDRGKVFLSHQMSTLLESLLRGHEDSFSLVLASMSWRAFKSSVAKVNDSLIIRST